jgi:hypothetical protein
MIRSIAAVTLMALPPAFAYAETYTADVWADNWFEMRIDGVLVAEDSVPITTERSFNAESFPFDAVRPFVIGIVAKDFKENDTGLEYIGTQRQQMGDGGLILQIRDASGETIAVSDADWQCLAIHTAPLDKSCESEADPVASEGACTFEAMEEPADWDRAGFDASEWPQADVYSERDVSPEFAVSGHIWAGPAVMGH